MLFPDMTLAPAHTANAIKHKFEFENLEVLSQPKYTPDFAPSNYHLFQAIVNYCTGRSSSVRMRLKTGARSFFLFYL